MSSSIAPTDLDRHLDDAVHASAALAELRPARRAALLRDLAQALDAAADRLLPVAAEETSLPDARLAGELARTTGQLRLFAAVLEDGAYLDVVIDAADPEATPPRPDLRRMKLPLGPVLVYAAGNFPFAFSVAGGDTASALAAGCAVLLKVHPGHPRLSALTAEVVRDVLAAADLPVAAFQLIDDEETSRQALTDGRVKAGAFTGSLRGGRALFDLASQRERPIPFYAEMGSLNPVFATPGAVRDRGSDLVAGFVGSFTLGTGQFCTKPGLLFLPAGHGLDDALRDAVGAVEPTPMLQPRLVDAYREGLAGLHGLDAVETIVEGEQGPTGVRPTLLRVKAAALEAFGEQLLEECFGPMSIVVEYDDVDDLAALAAHLDGHLTAAIHASPDELTTIGPLIETLRDRVGRLLFDGWPTGVAVAWSMQHGGPYPATTAALHTSVGARAIERFLRPIVFQDAPAVVLPVALRDGNELGVPRRVDGRLELGDR